MLENTKDASAQSTGNKLLDICLDVLEDRKDSSALAESVQIARHDLGQMQSEFEEIVSEQPQNIQAECAKEVEYAMECFKSYQEALDILEHYFKSADKFEIVRGAEKVRGISALLDAAFFNYRNRSLIAMGPTAIPILNLVLATHKSLVEASNDDIPMLAEKLLTIVQREYITVGRGLVELRRFNLIPEEELLKLAYEDHQQACLAIKDNVQAMEIEPLQASIESYSGVAARIYDLIPAVNLKRMTAMPTTSPQANLVLNLAKTLVMGTGAEEEMFLEALKGLEESFNNTKMQFEAVRRSPTDSVLVKEEMENAQKAIEAYEDAIMDFYKFLEVRDTLLLTQACVKLDEAVKLISKSGEAFQDIAEREGKTPCIRCSHYNPPDRKTCEKCGAVLPVSSELQTSRTFELEESSEGKPQEEDIQMTEHIYRLFDAVNKVSEGQIPMEEFVEVVNEMEQKVLEGKKAYGPLPTINIDSLKPEQKEQATSVRDMLEEAKEIFKEATDDLLTGITFFKQYIEKGDKNNLVSGVQIIWQGVGKLQKVDRATEVIKKTKEEAEK
jgi:tetratricopeptide (TPR) repeat protein